MTLTRSANERPASRLAAQVLAAAALLTVALIAPNAAFAQNPFNPYGSFTDSGPVTPEEKARREQVRTDLYDRLSPAYRIDVPFVSEASVAALEQAIQRYRQIVAAGGWPVTAQTVTLRQGDTSGEIAANGEGHNQFATRLLDLAEGRELASRRRTAELLLKLPLGDSERILALVVFALRDRPGALILLCPERAAGMHEQQLKLAARVAIHQNAGAAFRHPPRLDAKKPPRN